MSTQPIYCWYSEASKVIGYFTSFYRFPDGNIREVTCITSDKEGKDYPWKDKKLIGITTQENFIQFHRGSNLKYDPLMFKTLRGIR